MNSRELNFNLMFFLFIMGAHHPGEHSRQKHENESLNKTDQNFQKIKWKRNKNAHDFKYAREAQPKMCHCV